jgi:hypothetical protein
MVVLHWWQLSALSALLQGQPFVILLCEKK